MHVVGTKILEKTYCVVKKQHQETTNPRNHNLGKFSSSEHVRYLVTSILSGNLDVETFMKNVKIFLSWMEKLVMVTLDQVNS